MYNFTKMVGRREDFMSAVPNKHYIFKGGLEMPNGFPPIPINTHKKIRSSKSVSRFNRKGTLISKMLDEIIISMRNKWEGNS